MLVNVGIQKAIAAKNSNPAPIAFWRARIETTRRLRPFLPVDAEICRATFAGKWHKKGPGGIRGRVGGRSAILRAQSGPERGSGRLPGVANRTTKSRE